MLSSLKCVAFVWCVLVWPQQLRWDCVKSFFSFLSFGFLLSTHHRSLRSRGGRWRCWRCNRADDRRVRPPWDWRLDYMMSFLRLPEMRNNTREQIWVGQHTIFRRRIDLQHLTSSVHVSFSVRNKNYKCWAESNWEFLLFHEKPEKRFQIEFHWRRRGNYTYVKRWKKKILFTLASK